MEGSECVDLFQVSKTQWGLVAAGVVDWSWKFLDSSSRSKNRSHGMLSLTRVAMTVVQFVSFKAASYSCWPPITKMDSANCFSDS